MKERAEFPLDLEGRMDAVLNVVNTEFKSLTVLHLDDRAASGREICDRVAETVGGYKLLPAGHTFGKYCGVTLLPIGVVAKDKVLNSGGVGYMLTKEGKEYGLPVAAFALDWSYMNGKSLFEILGSTASSGEVRSPFQRTKTLKFLHKNEPSCFLDIGKVLGPSSSSYTNHLLPLWKAGFISRPPEELFSRSRNPYYLIKTPDSFSDLPFSRVSEQIVTLLNGVEDMGASQIAREIKMNQGYVSNALGHLFSSGYVGNKLDERIGMGGFSLNLKLEGEGKRFLDDFVYPIEEAMSEGPALEKMRETYEVLLGNPDIFREYGKNGCRLYRAVSPRLNHKGNTVKRVREFIRAHPKSRPKDIANALGLKKVNNALAILRKKEEIVFEKKGSSSHYSIVL